MGVNFMNKYQNLVLSKSEKSHIKILKFEVKSFEVLSICFVNFEVKIFEHLHSKTRVN